MIVATLGTDGDDSLTGTSGPDRIFTFAGNDTVYGGQGTDIIRGDGGDDFLVGGIFTDDFISVENADDLIIGGEGNDTILGGSFSTIPFELANGQPFEDSRGVKDGQTAGAGNNALWGGEGNDVIFGGSGNDTIGGSTGSDRIRPRGGDDLVYGGPGNDSIIKPSGSSVIFGGDGDDSIVAGFQSDTIWGGAGDDTMYGDETGFGFGLVSDDNTFSFISGHGDDVIFKYSASDDTLDLTGLDTRFTSLAELASATESVPFDHFFFNFALRIQTEDGSSILIPFESETSVSELSVLI